jgi:uncharacterized membrane protein YbhN (UPF0104 family)
MKKFLFVSSASLFLFACLYLYNNPEELTVLYQLNFKVVTLLLFIKFLTLLINSSFNKTLLKSFKLDIPNSESIYLGSLTFLGNLYLPARSGANLRMLYLNKKYDFKSPALASMYLYFFIVTILLNSFVGLLSLITVYKTYDFLFFFSFVSFLVMLCFSIPLTFRKFNLSGNKNSNKFFYWYNNLKVNWNLITSNKIVRNRLIFLTLFNYLLFAIEALILFNVLFDENNIFNIFYYNSLSVLSGLTTFTPASIGIKDTIIFLSSQILDLTFADVISLMIVERALLILFSIIPGIIMLINQKKIIK